MKRILFSLLVLLSLVACDQVQPIGAGVPAVVATPAPQVPATPSPTWPFTSPGAKLVLAQSLTTKNYLLVFDGSGSMNESACNDKSKSKDEVAKVAISEFARVVPKDANLGLVTFDKRGIELRVPLRKGEANRRGFAQAVSDTYPGGGTPLKDAITIGYNHLVSVAQTQLGYGEYHLIIITDGVADIGQDPLSVVKVASKTPVLIHTMGFCIGSGHSLNQKGVTFYLEASDLGSLRAGLKGVLAEAPTFDSTFRP